MIIPFAFIIVFILAIWGVVSVQKSFEAPPALDVSIPEISKTQKDEINLTGKTTPGAEITINDKKITIDKEGKFSYLYVLNNGENKVIFESKKGSSKPTILDRTVIREQEVLLPPVVIKEAEKTNLARETNLSPSGPTDNLGIVGLAGIIGSLIFYYKTKKTQKKRNFSYPET